MRRTLSFFLALLFPAALPAFASVNVSSPGNGAYVTTPFTLSASAPNCSNQTVAAMGYSIDSSTNTTIVRSGYINAQVPVSTGQHTVHVKAWGNQGAACVTDVVINVTGAAAASDGVNVSSPGNGSTLTSPFGLSATSQTCYGQPVAAMAYSVDNNGDGPAVYGKSLDTSVSASSGTHILHVKSWGNQGAGCVANISINVTGGASSGSGGSADGISVSTPGNGASVGSTFGLAASASNCSGQPVSAMGYSLDNSTNTTVVRSTSVDASISAAAGAHTLHVKSWGNQGAGCVANITVNVGAASPNVVPASTNTGGVNVSSPGNGSTVPSSFDVVANAGNCSGQPVSAMGYSLDNSTNTTTVSGGSLNAAVYAPGGQHTLHVKAWGNQGASCVANVAISVGGSGSSSGPAAPSGAVSVSSIQALGNWTEASDSGTSGHASGNMAVVSSPTLSGSSRLFNTSYVSGGGERYWVSFGDDTSSQNFLYDAWVYLTSSAGQIANLEMDMNQTMSNGQTVIYGFQCDGYAGVWDYTKNAGSPTGYNDQWVHSNAPCNVRNWSRNAWHHIQISYSRDNSGNVTYHAVWLDGVEQPINATVPSAFALGWGPTLLTNFQVDGLGSSGSSSVYLDKLTISRW